jgi:hypothetical protein
MGIMPHTDIDKALQLALGLDVPFWPQLPNISFYEDMYAQTSQNFPGIIVAPDDEKVSFNSARFDEELTEYSLRMAEPETFSLGQSHSAVYHRFLAVSLEGYPAIRGQVTGPVSFGFRVMDENSSPIIYHDGVRGLLFDFIQRKVNVQYHQLVEKNQNAFVWLDEPGLGWVFSGLSGYSDVQAKRDYHSFLAGIEGPKALHLCASINLPYLLGLGFELLSFDAYQLEVMPKGYVRSIADFLRCGGIISWGIVPTDSDHLNGETPETLARLLLGYWEMVSTNSDIALEEIARNALLAPARCCLKNVGRVGAGDDAVACGMRESPSLTIEEQLVEKAFEYLKAISEMLKKRYDL